MIRKTIFWIILSLLYLGGNLNSHGQPLTYQFTHLTVADGLSQSSVITILQGQDEIMWMGTRDGLNRYDGNDFTVFRNDLDDDRSISSNDILDLIEDDEGDLWIATYDGLNRYDIELETFTRFKNQSSNLNSLSFDQVRSVIQSKTGEILAGTAHGLNIINKDTREIVRIFSDSIATNSLLDNNIYKVFQAKDGVIWIGSSLGVTKMKYQSKQSQYEYTQYQLPGRVQAITQDVSGNIWLGTNKGLFELNEAGGKSIRLANSDLILNQDIRALTIDNDHNLWVGTYDGISVIEENGRIVNLQHDPLDPNSLSKNTIKSIYKDKMGAIWSGAYYGGVSIYNKANSNFRDIEQLANGRGLSYNVVSSIVENDDHIYFGTEGGGVSVLNKQTQDFSYLFGKESKDSDNVKSLYLDSQYQELWIGKFEDGITVWDLKNKKLKPNLDISSRISNDNVYDIEPLNDHQYLIGTFGGGLNLYDRLTDSITVFRNDPSNSFSLCNDQVRTVFVDSKYNIWTGTHHGLSLMKFEELTSSNYRMEHFFNDRSNDSGDEVLSIFEDSKGVIWVGTKESGLHFLKEDEFVSLALFDQFKNMSKTIHSMLEDEEGNLWISSNNGIIRFDPVSRATRLFQESDGLVSNEFNDDASLASIEGNFYFGGPSGVTSFFPSQIQSNPYTPNVVLTGLEVGNQSINANDSTGILVKSISTTDQFELAYDQAIFSIQFALPSYVNPNKNGYAYRLIGLDDNWQYTSTNEATFTIQNAGDYTFEVKGCNSDGVWNDNPTRLSVVIYPAPWKTWWAFMLYGAAMSLALYFLIDIIKSRAAYKHDLELELKENEQQRELNQMKLQFFTNISHEFRTPLTLILGPLQQIISEYRGSSTLFKQLVTIQQNANQLLKLINQLMEFRAIDNKQATLRAAEGNIVKFVKEIFLSFKPYAKSEGYDYQFISNEEEIIVYYDRDKMERVIYNLISNAFRYNKEGKRIKVELQSEDHGIKIIVEDNGIGMKSENINSIFERFYQVDSEGQPKKETSRGTGIGLALTKGIVDLHRGDIKVKSTYGEGSTFTVSLPTGNSHLGSNEIIENFKDSEDLDNYQLETNEGVEKLSSIIEVSRADQKSILIVEDNPEVRQFIVSLFDKSIYYINEASNGKQGVEMSIEHTPDLIISDVMMPEMDGIELCIAIKSNLKTSHIPVILLTARTSLIFKYEGLESGADDYINKPFNIKELQLKVKNLLTAIDTLRTKFSSEDAIVPSDITISSVDEELLQKAISIVDENISNEFFDIPLFCSELGVSRTMLFTKVKAWTNMTPNEFIQSMRMKRAAQFLEIGKVSVSQICFKVGYKNPKYFSKTFQKHFSMTPTAYANKFKSTIE